MLALVPLRVWLSLGLMVVVAIGIGWIDHRGFERGERKTKVAWEAERTANLKEIERLRAQQAVVVEKVVTVYRDRVKVIKEKADEIAAEIPVLVGMDSPLLDGRYRMLHDAAVAGSLPDDPAGVARATAPVTAAAFTAGVAENYASCRSDLEKLVALQSILKGKP